jgi:hypothetical protein
MDDRDTSYIGEVSLQISFVMLMIGVIVTEILKDYNEFSLKCQGDTPFCCEGSLVSQPSQLL